MAPHARKVWGSAGRVYPTVTVQYHSYHRSNMPLSAIQKVATAQVRTLSPASPRMLAHVNDRPLTVIEWRRRLHPPLQAHRA